MEKSIGATAAEAQKLVKGAYYRGGGNLVKKRNIPDAETVHVFSTCVVPTRTLSSFPRFRNSLQPLICQSSRSADLESGGVLQLALQ